MKTLHNHPAALLWACGGKLILFCGLYYAGEVYKQYLPLRVFINRDASGQASNVFDH